MDDPILEERLKKMFESRAGELPDESLREVRIRKRVYEQIEREETHMRIYEKGSDRGGSDLCIWQHDSICDREHCGSDIAQ